MRLLVEVSVTNWKAGTFKPLDIRYLYGPSICDCWHKNPKDTIEFHQGLFGIERFVVFKEDNFRVQFSTVAPVSCSLDGVPVFYNEMDEHSIYPALPDYLGVGERHDLIAFKDLAYEFAAIYGVDLGDDFFNITYYLVFDNTTVDDYPLLLGFAAMDDIPVCLV